MLFSIGVLVFLCLVAEVRGDTYSGHWLTLMLPISDLPALLEDLIAIDRIAKARR